MVIIVHFVVAFQVKRNAVCVVSMMASVPILIREVCRSSRVATELAVWCLLDGQVDEALAPYHSVDRRQMVIHKAVKVLG